jgi:uncharacterized protein involved in response to NO
MFDKIPIFALGFRPFYLLAAIFALAVIPLWLVSFGAQGIAWHSHEMIFGFAMAVVAGFLLTAVRNWTGQPTPVGGPLAAMAALWVLARILILTGPDVAAAVVDLAFLPVLGVAVAIPVIRSRNTRNYKILVVIAGLILANASYHLAGLGFLSPWSINASLIIALDIIAILVAIIGGRVTPAFIGNAIADAKPRHIGVVEFLSFGGLIAILVLDAMGRWISMPAIVWLIAYLGGAIAHGIRLLLWQPRRAAGNALLLMLPVAYAWLPVMLFLRAVATTGIISASVAFHAFTIGAIASLMMAMMTRSSLGHSGRSLVAGKAEIVAFVALQMSAVVRVIGASILPSLYMESLVISGVLWTVAFVVFLLRYAPILTQPRTDGRPG